MISGCEDVGAQVEEIFSDRRSYAKSAGRILGINDKQVYAPFHNHVRQVLAHNAPARAAENIADKKNLQNSPVS
jgi:hypothetical protein